MKFQKESLEGGRSNESLNESLEELLEKFWNDLNEFYESLGECLEISEALPGRFSEWIFRGILEDINESIPEEIP